MCNEGTMHYTCTILRGKSGGALLESVLLKTTTAAVYLTPFHKLCYINVYETPLSVACTHTLVNVYVDLVVFTRIAGTL